LLVNLSFDMFLLSSYISFTSSILLHTFNNLKGVFNRVPLTSNWPHLRCDVIIIIIE